MERTNSHPRLQAAEEFSSTFRPNVKSAVLVRERRSALVRAAIDVFSEKGYYASRVTDVAAAAGVSQGTVYNYVKCKEDLLYMICEDHFRGYERIVGAAVADASSPRAKLEALLEATVEVIFLYRKHFTVMLRELHHVDRKKRRSFFDLAASQREMCQRILCDVAKTEKIALGNPLITANLLVYLPKLIVSRGWDLGGRANEDEIKDGILSFMRRGLGLAPRSERRRALRDRRRVAESG
jgi:AcrR family transcriptional regulator